MVLKPFSNSVVKVFSRLYNAIYCAKKKEEMENHGIDMLPIATITTPTEDNSRKEWFRAARENNVNKVKDLINSGFYPNTLDKKGWAALHLAAWNGYDELCGILISAKCDVDIASRDGSTPLTLAAQKGHTAIVQRLIQAFCNVQKSASLNDCTDVSALHLAAQYGHRDVVEALIKSGASVGSTMSVRGVTGVTPLHLAVEADHIEVIEVLLASGVDVNISTRPASESIV